MRWTKAVGIKHLIVIICFFAMPAWLHRLFLWDSSNPQVTFFVRRTICEANVCYLKMKELMVWNSHSLYICWIMVMFWMILVVFWPNFPHFEKLEKIHFGSPWSLKILYIWLMSSSCLFCKLRVSSSSKRHHALPVSRILWDLYIPKKIYDLRLWGGLECNIIYPTYQNGSVKNSSISEKIEKTLRHSVNHNSGKKTAYLHFGYFWWIGTR